MRAPRNDVGSKAVRSNTLCGRAKFAGVALALSSAWLFWTPPAAGMEIVDSGVFRVVLDPRDSNILYAGTSNGIFKSTDQAESWYAINSGLPGSPRVRAVTVDPQDSQTIYVGLDFPDIGIFKSTNGGDVWEPTGRIGLMVRVHSIVIDPNDPNRVHGAGDGTPSYVRSTNGGRDWSSEHYFVTARGMAMDPFDSNTIYLALRYPFPPSFGGIAKTIDGGDEWTRPEAGLPREFAHSLAIDPWDSSTVYLGFENGGIYKTTSGGKAWFPTGLLRGHMTVVCLAIDPQDSNTLYAGTSEFNVRLVFKSTDGGDNWYPANKGLEERLTQSLAIDLVYPNILYAGTESGLFKSTDGAESWALTGL